jgi:hypothetical protein
MRLSSGRWKVKRGYEMRPIGYRLNVEVSGIEELKEACKEVSKKAEELQEAIDRLSIIEIELKAKPVKD